MPLYDADGRPAFLLGISEDITERRRIEAERRRWAGLFERSHWPVATVSSSPEPKLERANAAFARLLGFAPGELDGASVTQLTPPDARAGFVEELARAGDSGQHTFEALLLRRDGSTVETLVNVSASEEGGARALNVQDVSTLKGTEAELRAAKEAAEANSRDLEAFSYSVSHDLRAPLRSIDGFSQAILEDYGDQLDASAKGYLGRVRNAAQRMSQLIDDCSSCRGSRAPSCTGRASI